MTQDVAQRGRPGAPQDTGDPWRPAIRLALLLCLLSPSAAAPGASALPVREIAPGVFLHPGRHDEAAPDDLEDIANIGFVVGSEAVAVIDAGGSLRLGEALRAAVRRVTPLPIRFVILSHVHPDHMLGAAAFDAPGTHFVGHRRLPHALAQRGAHYLAQHRRTIDGSGADPRVVTPDRLVRGSLDLDLGARVLRVTAHPTAHTDNDLSVYDRTTGTLWLSDLLFREHIPVLDGSLTGWLAVMDGLEGVPASLVVPGHGPPTRDWPAAMSPQRVYLRALASDVRSIIGRGGSLREAVAALAESHGDRWRLADAYHQRNVTAAFVELEWE